MPRKLPYSATVTVHEGDNLDHLKSIPDNSLDSVVTDPPYGLSFMGKKWDHDVPTVEFWTEVFRVLKPGGYLLSFGGTRTYHRMVCNIEDAGFEIRDQIAWLYGQGFPKSRNLSKDIDRIHGAKRVVVGRVTQPGFKAVAALHGQQTVIATEFDKLSDQPVSPEATQWVGYGTALKPAQEPVVVARKPHKGSIAANVLTHGVGGFNIDGSRVLGGRFPANVIHDGSEAVLAVFPHTKTGKGKKNAKGGFSDGWGERGDDVSLNGGDEGSAARYFYCAKPSAKERREAETSHITIKPLALMRYLVRLVTPVGGTTLDPFAGSGSTGVAAVAEGVNVILMERDPDYAAGIRKRLAAQPTLTVSCRERCDRPVLRFAA